jgi:RecA-family ATPase
MISQAVWKQMEENRQPIDFVEAIKNEAETFLNENSSQEYERTNLKPLRAVRFSDIEAKKVDWLWLPFLALGTFNLMEDEEGLGKTFLALALLCAVAAGKGLPGVAESEHIEASNVLIISAEDSVSYVLKPRLESMNANCERIIAIEEPFTLDDEGIFRLKMVLAEYEPKLVIIDPLFSYTGRVNLDRDSDIRSIHGRTQKTC